MMIAEIGHFALVLALMVAIVQAVVPMIGAQRGDAAWMAVGRPAAMTQFLFVAISFGCLVNAYATSDFSLVNVAQNSNSLQPMLYKITATWGNHEGSMLLWVLILAIYGGAVAAFGRNLPPTLQARVISVQSLIAVGFYLFILLTSNPFERSLPAPIDGRDLNPLLQDPGLAFHPPFLYLGYVGFSIAYSFAIAALIEGRVDAAWARWVRPWTLAAWSFLTVGIGLGSWWAYYELGWGGWWFWDPVENASFMPWLAGTALLHSAVVVEKRDTLKGWTVLLAVIAFSLSLLGTFIVRSGVLTSVHSFAADPERGVFILGLLLIVTGGSFALFAWRGPQLKSGGLFQPVSREGGLLLNNLIMTTATAAVLLGTLYPLFIDAMDLGKVSVGPPFFNRVFVPLMIPMIIAMGVAPFLSWKRADLGSVMMKLKYVYVLVIVGILVAWWAHTDGPILAALGVGMAVWLFFATLYDLAERTKLFKGSISTAWRRAANLPRAQWGMTLAHGGLAIAIVGMIGASVWKVESIQVMKPGDSVTVGGYDYTFVGARKGRGPNYTLTSGAFNVAKDGEPVTVVYPEKRTYIVQKMPTTEAAIVTRFWGDLYVTIGDEDRTQGRGAYVTRIYYNPLVAWLWAGISLLVLGGVVSLSDRRHRVGAPQKTRRKDQAATAGA